MEGVDELRDGGWVTGVVVWSCSCSRSDNRVEASTWVEASSWATLASWAASVDSAVAGLAAEPHNAADSSAPSVGLVEVTRISTVWASLCFRPMVDMGAKCIKR
jgi:hypothetical protein